jgi:translation initiation factor IF-1
MKINSIVFTIAVAILLLVAIASYYVGVSGRKSNQAHQSTHTIKKQLESSINDSIEKEIKEQLIACHIEQPGVANELAAKIKYELSVLTRTDNGKYKGFVKISTGDIVKVNILEDDESFYYEAETGFYGIVAKERQKTRSNMERKCGI